VTAHPGASAPARRWPPGRWADAVAELTRRGRRVVLTGGAAERALTAAAAAGGRSGAAGPDRSHAAGGAAGADPSHAAGANRCHTAGTGAERYAADGAVTDLGGRTSLARLAAVLAGADAVLVGNTGAAHLAAAVGTPVVSLFAPVVPAARWAPYGVPHVLLGDQSAPCRDSCAVRCPVPGHPCLAGVTAAQACDALDALVAGPRAAAVGRAAP
jgi:ADP-heptose:LPS heptosyltransferase